MTATERRRMVNGAIALIETTEGWDWILPPAKSTLERMAGNADAPQAVRQRLSDGLRRTITDKSFLADPLAAHLMRVVIEFPA